MYKGDIAPFESGPHVAVMFEGVLMRSENVELPTAKKSLWDKIVGRSNDVEAVTTTVTKTWRANEWPIKSVVHMMEQWGMGVEVWTYLPQEYQEDIEHWLARKGARVLVRCFDSFEDLYDELRLDRSIHTFFTSSKDDAYRIGPRATLVSPDHTIGGV